MMRSLNIALALAAAAVGSQGAMAALAIGAKAPDFTTRGAMAGKTFTLTLSHQLNRGPGVLYFFPQAFTPGCPAEAREFAEHTEDFRKARSEERRVGKESGGTFRSRGAPYH